MLCNRGLNVVELDEVFRQRDSRLLDTLNEFRIGECSDDSLDLIEYCKSRVFPDDGIIVRRAGRELVGWL